MHLLAAQPGILDDGARAVDPGQTPADVVFLSAADSDLALLSAARAGMDDAPTLRLWSLASLAHPLSVDLHLAATASRSRLVIARVLGGTGYWRYGIAQYSAGLHAAGVPFVALPGDDRPDEELRALSTVGDADYAALWAYVREGGLENAEGLLRHARSMLDETPGPAPARPLPRAGAWWPGGGGLQAARTAWTPGAPVAPVVFYRALVQSGGTAPIAHLAKALLRAGLNPLPIFVASLKDEASRAVLTALMADASPSVILNATAFAVGSPGGGGPANPLAGPEADGAPVLQVILAGSGETAWAEGTRGLSATDIAMNVALPEIDGRIVSRAISFKDEAHFDEATECPIVTHVPKGDRVRFVTDLAAGWARLRATPAAGRRVALVLANYPDRDGRLANGVGLDTPASTVACLRLMAEAGYGVEGAPEDGQALMDRLMAGPTNHRADRAHRVGGEGLPLAAYHRWFDALPWEAKSQVTDRWGPPEVDPFVEGAAFRLGIHRMGNAVVGIQPARGYGIDPKATYHAPDLVPPHHYLAFQVWLREVFGAHAIVHMGKHGNLEWLPGKAVALSATCWPEIALGPLPHLYPFIVNDPGEGTQAKRRAQAVILDHLTPPMTRAETYGPLRDLEVLLDELSQAQATDPKRADHLRREIGSLTATTGIAEDAGLPEGGDLQALDAWICELKEAQIRDGLHVYGASPEGIQARDLALALARVPRGDAASLPRALAADLGLAFDPLDPAMAEPWTGPRPDALASLSADPWRTTGDTVERLELLSQAMLDGIAPAPGKTSELVLTEVETHLRPLIAACGPAEASALLTALNGRAVPPGPSGAPTRGRPDVLPTGRNFYSVDARALPTRAAWTLGRRSAEMLVERHLQDQGDWPRALLLTAWGTSCMRTGGDDIAQGLALMGVQPVWEAMSGRVTGFEVLPLALLDRPRVDVTLRISGFFRDAFPALVALFDSAARAVQALDEEAGMNAATLSPGPRVYGAKPGAYGAGLQALIDERGWETRDDLGRAYLAWGGFSYGAHQEGAADGEGFAARLTSVEGIVQNQDNREHDLLDSDDYYQFEGGAAAAVGLLRGRAVPVYHNDHSRPERPVIRTLEEEVARVVRSRVINPKWIAGVMRHGYKGAFEMAATVDYLFAFAATTGAVKAHHFDAVDAAYLEDESVRDFIAAHNAPALREIAARLAEAIDRGLWTPRSNSVRSRLAALAGSGEAA